MKIFVIFIGFVVLGCVSQSNFTLPSQQYVDSSQLFTLPGVEDIIGYGFDARYSSTEDGLKKPIVAYTFASAKVQANEWKNVAFIFSRKNDDQQPIGSDKIMIMFNWCPC